MKTVLRLAIIVSVICVAGASAQDTSEPTPKTFIWIIDHSFQPPRYSWVVECRHWLEMEDLVCEVHVSGDSGESWADWQTQWLCTDELGIHKLAVFLSPEIVDSDALMLLKINPQEPSYDRLIMWGQPERELKLIREE